MPFDTPLAELAPPQFAPTRPHPRPPKRLMLDGCVSPDGVLPPGLCPDTGLGLYMLVLEDEELRHKRRNTIEQPAAPSWETVELLDVSDAADVVDATLPLPLALPRLPLPVLGPKDPEERMSWITHLAQLLPESARLLLAYSLLQAAPRPALTAIAANLRVALKRDVVALLPMEIALEVWGYLDRRLLSRCLAVLSLWRRLALLKECDMLWKRRLGGDGYVTCAEMAALQDASGRLTNAPHSLFHAFYRARHTIHLRWMDPAYQPRRISVPLHGHQVVTCLQYDDDKIISGADDKMINVYETATGRPLRTLTGHDGGVWALKYLNNTLVLGLTDRTVRIWNIHHGRCIYIFRGHTLTVRCLDIIEPVEYTDAEGVVSKFPPEPWLVTGSRDNTLYVWKLPVMLLGDTPPHEPLDFAEHENPFFIRALTGHLQSVRAIAGHGRTLVSGSYDHTVRVWDLVTGRCRHVLKGHTDRIYLIILDVPRNRCISGLMDLTSRIWDLDTGECLYTLKGHELLVGLLQLLDRHLVLAAADSTLRVWDPSDGLFQVQMRGHTGPITCFQHDEFKVVSGSEGMLKLFDIKTGRFVRDLLTNVTGGIWQVKYDWRRCVAAVQCRAEGSDVDETVIEILDFGEEDGAAKAAAIEPVEDDEASMET